MKRYWPLLFLATLLIFQAYVFLWNQKTPIANSQQEKKTQQKIPSPTLSSCQSLLTYPKAIYRQNFGNSILQEAGDDPLTVINWYKSTLSAQTYLITSSVDNITNGTISFMITAEKNNNQITVIAGKGESEQTTTIFVHQNIC